MESKGAHFSSGTRRVAVELWRAKVPLKKIMDQLQMSKTTLLRLLCHAKENPDVPVKPRKKGTGLKNSKVLDITLKDMKMRLQMSSAGKETLPSTSQ